MSKYRSYFISQLGIKESTFKPVDIDPESIDPKELEKGIGVEHEHTQDDVVAKKIALHHLAEDPHYYSRMDKAGLKEFSPMKSIMSPTARTPQVLGISIRGSSTGGLPSGGMPTLGPTSLCPSDTAIAPEGSGVDPKSSIALGGLELVSKQAPNSVVVDNTPQNQTINSAAPIAKDLSEPPSETHPAQVQNLKHEPVQSLTGTPEDQESPMGDKPEPEQFEVDQDPGEEDMSLAGACPKGIDIEVPEGENEEESEGEEDEDAPTNVVKDEDDEDKESLNEWGKHKTGCQCGFCKNKGKMGKKKDEKSKKDDYYDGAWDSEYAASRKRNDAADGPDESKKSKSDEKQFGTSLDEVFARHKKLMKEKLGIGDGEPPVQKFEMDSEKAGMVKVGECKPCGCKKPNTAHDKKTPKLTNESLKKIHEQLVRKSQKVPLNEQEKEIARRIITRLKNLGAK